MSAATGNGPAYWSARETAQALAERRISARELLDHVIARIEALDGPINAVVVRDFDRAREAARAADAALARGERRPLLGVPMTVKESHDVAGLPTTWGLPDFRDWRPEEDGTAIARLKQAGAVVIGKTNVPTALGDWQSANEIYGFTRNPWDPARSPGGSSGGGAAALAAGFVPLELGSDIGGSIRVPAAFCGVFGHKPSVGLLPFKGHTFPGTHGGVDLAVIGPLARSAADLDLALDILAGPDEEEAAAYRLALPPARHAALRDYRVLVVDTHPVIPTAASVRGALDRLGGRLAAAGAQVARSSALLPDLAQADRIYLQLLMPILMARLPAEAYAGMQSAAANLPADDQSLPAQRLRASVLSHREWLYANEARVVLRRQWRALFREFDVVLTPAFSTPAFPHDHSPDVNAREAEVDGVHVPYFDQLAWPGVASVAGLPATIAPVDRDPAGLPIGVAINGPFLEDRTTIGFAQLIEQALGGFVPPPGFAG
jgi:amidase